MVIVGGTLAVVGATVGVLGGGGSLLLFGGAVTGPVAFLSTVQALVVALVTL